MCSGLNASEIKVIDLKGRRILKYLCDDCQSGLLQVPKILQALDDLRAEVTALKADVAKKPSTNSITNSPTGHLDNNVFSELQDRQARADNLMVFNLPEHEHDMEDVKNLFSTVLKVHVQPKGVTRIGKPNKNGFRALKVLLHNKDDVQTAIKGRSKLKAQKFILI